MIVATFLNIILFLNISLVTIPLVIILMYPCRDAFNIDDGDYSGALFIGIFIHGIITTYLTINVVDYILYDETFMKSIPC